MGVLDVQSTQSGAFGPDTIVMLQTLASQIAAAIHNVNLSESIQGNTGELERLYRSSLQIAAAQSKDELIQSDRSDFAGFTFRIRNVAGGTAPTRSRSHERSSLRNTATSLSKSIALNIQAFHAKILSGFGQTEIGFAVK